MRGEAGACLLQVPTQWGPAALLGWTDKLVPLLAMPAAGTRRRASSRTTSARSGRTTPATGGRTAAQSARWAAAGVMHGGDREGLLCVGHLSGMITGSSSWSAAACRSGGVGAQQHACENCTAGVHNIRACGQHATLPAHAALLLLSCHPSADGHCSVLHRQAGAACGPREGRGRGRHRGLLHPQGKAVLLSSQAAASWGCVCVGVRKQGGETRLAPWAAAPSRWAAAPPLEPLQHGWTPCRRTPLVAASCLAARAQAQQAAASSRAPAAGTPAAASTCTRCPHNPPPPSHPMQVENVECIAPNQIKFDFLGKDSIRYENTVEVSGR